MFIYYVRQFWAFLDLPLPQIRKYKKNAHPPLPPQKILIY